MALIEHGIIGQVYDEIRIFHKLSLLLRHRGDGGGTGLVAAQDGLYPGHQLLGVEGLYHIVVGSQLQPQDLVEDLSLGRKHDDGDLGDGAQLPAYLVAVDPREHQIQQHQVWLKGRKFPERRFPIPHDLCFIAFLHQVQ